MHDRAERLFRVYCKDVKDVPKGPIAFDGKPLQLGMLENGLWNTRPGQWDTQGQNIWALVQHYKLSGDRSWLEKTAYPYIRRGALWIVNSRHKHMAEVKDPKDPRYGLLEPGAMEVMEAARECTCTISTRSACSDCARRPTPRKPWARKTTPGFSPPRAST